MNSQFRNSNFGFILYTAIVTIMVLATGFVIWYMTVGYRVGTFGPDTRLGSVYIGGLTEPEVIPLLDERIDYWYSDDTIRFQLTYQDYVYYFDRDLILFDLELSTYKLTDGITNELVAKYQTEDLEMIRAEISALPFLQDVLPYIDINIIIDDVLSDAELMRSYSNKHVEDYLGEATELVVELGSSPFRVPEGVQIDSVITDIIELYPETNGQIFVPEKTLFDITSVLGSSLNDQELTMLSSAMLATILDTNFIINEVHYEPDIDFTMYTIDTYPYFGRNTVITRIVDESFSFYNPNEFSYYFTVEKTDDFNGELKLYGVPFEYDIEANILKTEIPYITQSTNNVNYLQIGYNGVIIDVERVITDVYGNVEKDNILFEFYPPINRIIFEP
ncbi:hypothetical protein [Candidatus Xianfuyuplasma coldseepsis]|uniref:Peptidoglycan binding domain-containing protein n=1 Tax=Candidatus Xianfuyuplasma coldseepsis TaxID=2782163 RepID=A0A7L7KSY7_9MOLU|nr:hypothetical protein [Xianfuyuplasma coldseepsis]QMS85930.1 hypothetical protein G4Z02_09275 [Xianfuyuplasma coldseepsis]